MDEVHRRLARRIRELAKARKIPVSHLPDLAAVSRSYFWDVLKGKNSPTLLWLERIAGALGVDVEELVVRRAERA
ncbi:MAG: helix-turn-helix transcriptional regulator [Myxococcales bacterium]